MAHFFLSAAHKSSGKTTVSVGLAAAITARGLRVQTFKKGPDYIDPMWLARASGQACYNLDFNTQDEREIAALFARNAAQADISLIEGNKGLYDGVDPDGRDSSAALARLVESPIILVIDATGITRGIAPLVLGYRMFDREAAIQGVILNRVASPRQEQKLRQALDRYTDVPVLGALGRDPALVVRERHLGLTTPDEIPASNDVIDRFKRAVEHGVDVDRVIDLGRAAPAKWQVPAGSDQDLSGGRGDRPGTSRDVRIAVARDAAFGFYYPDDLDALTRSGAELVFFDTLRDTRFPAADALFIGGGFPETQMDLLAANDALRAEIRDSAEKGLPIYAECGGLMYLTRSITWGSQTFEMVGFIQADTVVHPTPQARGLVVLEETDAFPWPHAGAPAYPREKDRLPAHEFHHAALQDLDTSARFAYRVIRGHGIDGQHDGIIKGNVLASFCHLRSTERSGCWARRFVDFVRARSQSVRSRCA